MDQTSFDIDIRSILIPATKVLRASPEDTLDHALAKTQSSHDAVFVFNEEDKFLGFVSPSYAFFRKRYPYTTKIKSCLVNPPHITDSTSIFQIAEFMVATGIYTLPVFQGERISGLITAKSILRVLEQNQSFFSQVARVLKPENPVTTPSTSSAQTIYTLMREKKISRVVLVGTSGRVDGIVSRRDLQFLLAKPGPRQRIKTGGKGFSRSYVFGIEKESRLNVPVAPFAQRNVLLEDMSTGKENILERLINSEKNSIVIVDKDNRPTGIISIRVLLQALVFLKPELQIPVIIKNAGHLRHLEVQWVKELAYKLGIKLSKRSPIERIEIAIKESKDPVGRPDEFELAFHILFFSGNTLIASGKDRDFKKAVRKTIQRIKRQQPS
ncbi:MAG: CBS domain-containing protein [Patescibacteria group bacterium]